MSSPLPYILITTASNRFLARLSSLAPSTTKLFLSLLPYNQSLIHVRWSGEGLWIPLGDTSFNIPWENHTSHPAPGEFILYPGGISEGEFLVAYGGVDFSSKMGQLSGNMFMSIVEVESGDVDWKEALRELGVKTLWEGAQKVTFDIADEETVKAFQERHRARAVL